MSESVHVEAARIPDRDRLLAMLRDHGLTAEPEGEVDIRIPCDDGAADGACDEILQHVESVVFDLGAPFIPQKHEGVIYVRPPLA